MVLNEFRDRETYAAEYVCGASFLGLFLLVSSEEKNRFSGYKFLNGVIVGSTSSKISSHS